MRYFWKTKILWQYKSHCLATFVNPRTVSLSFKYGYLLYIFMVVGVVKMPSYRRLKFVIFRCNFLYFKQHFRRFTVAIMFVGVAKSLATDGGQAITHCFSILYNLRFTLYESMRTTC